MKKTKILMLFLVIGLIISLFTSCIPTIPTNSTDQESEDKGGLKVEADVDPKNGLTPLTVQCVGFVSGGSIPYMYQWEFGDGNWSEKGSGIEHRNLFYTYTEPGKYEPILHVEDSTGKKGSCKAGLVEVCTKKPFNNDDKFPVGSDFQWKVINTNGDPESPGPNYYSSSIENVWLDEQDRLHLKIVYNENTDRWECASLVSLKEGWGYGKYTFEIADVIMETVNKKGKISYINKLDENVVIGLYTYDGSNTAHKSHNELDIEFARWGNTNAKSGNFVVWYDATPGNLMRNLYPFSLQLVGNNSVHSFEWNEDGIQFDSTGINKLPDYPNDFEKLGTENEGYNYIPEPNNERVCINIWLITRKDEDGETETGEPFNISGNKKMKSAEIIISNFEFNSFPEINSLIANPSSIGKGENSTITCTASDSDVGDILIYDWSAPDGGTISGSGSSVTWTAPNTVGIYSITCTVSDGKGGWAEASVNIEVIDTSLVQSIKIFLQSGSSLNGVLIDTSNPILSVLTGQNISGTLKIKAQRPTTTPGNIVPLGYTTTWGPHSSSYVQIDSWIPTGTSYYDVNINLVAPSTPGIYYLIFASRPETGLGWVMSQTNWTTGTMHWNDGNDIADLNESSMSGVLSSGYCYLNMLEGGSYHLTTYGISYIKINVTSD